MSRTCRGSGLLLLPAWVSLLSGCGDGEMPEQSSLVSDSAGVRIVTADADRLELEAPLRLHPEPHLRIGAIDGAEGDLLTSPAGAVRLSDERLLVVESGARRARLMSREGAFLDWVGGIGEGPSEYQQLSGGGALEGDTLWLHDRSRNRVLLFTPEGKYHRAIAYDRPGGAGQIRYVRVLPGGPIVDLATTMGGDALSRATGGRFEERILLHTLSRTGEDLELVSDLPGGIFEMQTMDLPGGQRGVAIRNIAPSLSLPHQVEVGPDASVWITDAEAFELRRLDLDGVLREVFRVRAPQTPVTPALVEEHERLLLEQFPPEAREGMEAGFAVRDYAATLPPIQRLLADDTGLLWVSEYVGHRPGELPRVWWVIEPDGDLLGRVEVAEGFRILQIGLDEVLGVVQDEYEVPYLVGYALER